MFRLFVFAARSNPIPVLGRAASDGIEHVQYFFKRRIHDKAYVVGTWVCPKSSNTFEVTKPAKDAVFSSFSLIRQSDTQSPNQAAYTSFPSWKYTTGNVSSTLLHFWYNAAMAKQNQMIDALKIENGKPAQEAVEEIYGSVLLPHAVTHQKFLNRQRVGTISALTLHPNSQLSINSELSHRIGGIRSVVQYSFQKGKKKTVKDVIYRFYRLYWGAWIRPKAGRHRKVWRKSNAMRKRALQHVLTNSTQSHMLDKMVCRFWREKKFYVDDPYESYHKRDNFYITRRWP